MDRDDRITTTEAARRLRATPADVYRLIFAGELPGKPDADGIVRIREQAVTDFLERQAEV